MSQSALLGTRTSAEERRLIDALEMLAVEQRRTSVELKWMIDGQ